MVRTLRDFLLVVRRSDFSKKKGRYRVTINHVEYRCLRLPQISLNRDDSSIVNMYSYVGIYIFVEIGTFLSSLRFFNRLVGTRIFLSSKKESSRYSMMRVYEVHRIRYNENTKTTNEESI